MTTAEEYAHAAAEAARRASVKAESVANATLEMQQMIGRMERELRDIRREMAVHFTSIRESIIGLQHKKNGPRSERTVTHEDFEETNTGRFKVSKEIVSTILEEQELEKDAKKWRTLWRKVRSVVWVVVGGIASLLAEQAIQRWILK